MKSPSVLIKTIVAAVIIVSLTAPAQAQNDGVKTTMFKEVDSVMAVASAADAAILTPENFSKAKTIYSEASQDFEKGKNLEDIRKKINRAKSIFADCLNATKLARVTFAKSLDVRSDALAAEAPTYAGTGWIKAEMQFREAATKLEDGDVKAAQKKAREADDLYRSAELEAINTAYLKETWSLLQKAKNMKVSEQAPKTLATAESLVRDAEDRLTRDRYDTDMPRSLAQRAKYQALHAIYLSDTIRKMRADRQGFEDIFLTAEEPLRAVAASFDVVAHFDQGMDKVAAEVIDSIVHLRDSVSRLTQYLDDRNQEMAGLTARISEFELQLGDFAKEKTTLTQKMEAEAQIRQKFATVEKAFDPEEARVLREGNDVIIRLVGLSFDVGQSVIEPQYFSLLTKIKQSVGLFPDATITVQGHTDSFGGDETNRKLSHERAVSVKKYFMANMNLPDSDIQAEGLGETRPIANNETPEGRTKNRRIDIVIHPKIAGTE